MIRESDSRATQAHRAGGERARDRTAAGHYGAIAVFNDGPHGIRQLTYGRSQTTEYGKLRLLVARYVGARGAYAKDLADYADRIGAVPLTGDARFRSLLRTAGRTDPVMRAAQDAFFEEEFFVPAMRWAAEHGFAFPLSALVIYDSFIHRVDPPDHPRRVPPSPAFLGRRRADLDEGVRESPPRLGAHTRAAVRKTVYRTRCLIDQIRLENWQLALRPVRVGGVEVG